MNDFHKGFKSLGKFFFFDNALMLEQAIKNFSFIHVAERFSGILPQIVGELIVGKSQSMSDDFKIGVLIVLLISRGFRLVFNSLHVLA